MGDTAGTTTLKKIAQDHLKTRTTTLTPFLGMSTIVDMGARPAASGLYIGP